MYSIATGQKQKLHTIDNEWVLKSIGISKKYIVRISFNFRRCGKNESFLEKILRVFVQQTDVILGDCLISLPQVASDSCKNYLLLMEGEADRKSYRWV